MGYTEQTTYPHKDRMFGSDLVVGGFQLLRSEYLESALGVAQHLVLGFPTRLVHLQLSDLQVIPQMITSDRCSIDPGH